jgi:glutamate 5-kinase
LPSQHARAAAQGIWPAGQILLESAMSRAEAPQNTGRPEWAKARRIVVKIGSSLLVNHARGEINSAWLESLAADIAALAGAGKQVIIVSSGAIALGRHVL